MGEVKQINIENRTYYFYSDIIDSYKFWCKVVKNRQKIIQRYWYLLRWIYNKEKINDCENIYSVNPLYLSIDHANGYIEEKKWNKYLIFDSTGENKDLLKKYDVWNGIKNKIKEVDDSEFDCEKDYMKIKFNYDDNLPLKKPLKFHLMTIIIRCIFTESSKFYPQLLLDDADMN